MDVCLQDEIIRNEISHPLAAFKYYVYNNTLYIRYIMYYVISEITSDMAVFDVSSYYISYF